MAKSIQCHIRMTEQTRRELDALVENSVSPTTSEFVRQLVHEKYQQLEKGEFEMSKKFNRRQWLEQKFYDLEVGDLPEIHDLTDEQLENLIGDIEELQAKYLSGEGGGVESNAFMDELEQVVTPYLENAISPGDWVDYLIQISAIESEQEYADWVLNTPITEVSQTLANQPCDTPTAERLYEWAENFEND